MRIDLAFLIGSNSAAEMDSLSANDIGPCKCIPRGCEKGNACTSELACLDRWENHTLMLMIMMMMVMMMMLLIMMIHHRVLTAFTLWQFAETAKCKWEWNGFLPFWDKIAFCCSCELSYMQGAEDHGHLRERTRRQGVHHFHPHLQEPMCGGWLRWVPASYFPPKPS